jgi:hypothetical protein
LTNGVKKQRLTAAVFYATATRSGAAYYSGLMLVVMIM